MTLLLNCEKYINKFKNAGEKQVTKKKKKCTSTPEIIH